MVCFCVKKNKPKQSFVILATAEMSLPRVTRLLAGAQCHQRLLLPSITPLSVSGRTMIQGEYRRPGRPKEHKYPWQTINFDLKKGLGGIQKNFLLLKKEFFDRWVGPEGKPIIEHMLEQNRVVWEFRGPESLEQWTLSCDREIGGESEVHLKLGRNNTTCFLSGTLASTPPKDGETRYSGYCTMRSKQQLVSLEELPATLLPRPFCSPLYHQWHHMSITSYLTKNIHHFVF